MKAITREWLQRAWEDLTTAIEARYPGEMGLLPYGKPTQAEASDFYNFARQLYEQVQTVLGSAKDNDSPEQETPA